MLVCACGRIDFDPAVSRFGDATADDTPVDAAPLGPFGPFNANAYQSFLTSAQREYGTTISDDGLEVYWSTYRADSPAGGADLWRATRPDRDVAFMNAMVVSALTSDMDDGEPTLSRDGLTLYLERSQLFVATRPDASTASWSTPTLLDPALAGFVGADFGPDDLRLVLYNMNDRNFYETTRPDRAAAWNPPQLLAGFGIMGDGYPSIRADGLEIFWETDRSGVKSCWHAFRAALDQPFTGHERMLLGPNVDGFQCGDPDISGDGRTLVFVSTAAGTGEYDIWTAERNPI